MPHKMPHKIPHKTPRKEEQVITVTEVYGNRPQTEMWSRLAKIVLGIDAEFEEEEEKHEQDIFKGACQSCKI